MKIKSYRDLEVWKLGMDLADRMYELTSTLPGFQKYALARQLQRATVSIPSNIAEGFGRLTTRDFIHFLSIARGSTMELETQLTLAVRLKFVTREAALPIRTLAEQVCPMLSKLISTLQRKLPAKRDVSPTTNHETRTTLGR